jgi:hypothetical protein
MDLFDTLTWNEILVKTTFLGIPTLIVPNGIPGTSWLKLFKNRYPKFTLRILKD